MIPRSETSIRDELIDTVAVFWAVTDTPEQVADAIMASPVYRRIQAEALREAHADLQAYTDAGSPFGHRPIEEFLLRRADRIEREVPGE